MLYVAHKNLGATVFLCLFAYVTHLYGRGKLALLVLMQRSLSAVGFGLRVHFAVPDVIH